MAASGRTEPTGAATADVIRRALAQALPAGATLLVAFSGGRDSTVLLHALAGLRQACRFGLRAAHVDHGLQAQAGDWAQHCAVLAGRLGIPLLNLAVDVRDEQHHGIEAAARTARYAALKAQMRPGEYLLTGHHADDQLETVLLHLFRGSGVAGLAGIPASTAFGIGHLLRPLLDVPSRTVQDYAEHILRPAGITWLTDPMNADPAFDRSFLRHQLVPMLVGRFPAAAAAAGRTAVLAAEAAGLLDDLAVEDAKPVLDPHDSHRLNLRALQALKPARQRNLIRFLARQRGWAVPPERRLRMGLPPLLEAGSGKLPLLRWGGHEIRRYRDFLYLLDVAVTAAPPAAPLPWSGRAPLELGHGRGVLSFKSGSAATHRTGVCRLDARLLAAGFAVGFRDGGERLRPAGDAHHRSLKYLFQSAGIVPWMRPHIPLLIAGGELAAVGDLWIASWAADSATNLREDALEVIWSGHGLLR